jgi:hypothetical protein
MRFLNEKQKLHNAAVCGAGYCLLSVNSCVASGRTLEACPHQRLEALVRLPHFESSIKSNPFQKIPDLQDAKS